MRFSVTQYFTPLFAAFARRHSHDNSKSSKVASVMMSPPLVPASFLRMPSPAFQPGPTGAGFVALP